MTTDSLPPELVHLVARAARRADERGAIDRADLALALKEIVARRGSPRLLRAAGLLQLWAWELLREDSDKVAERFAHAPQAAESDGLEELLAAPLLAEAYAMDDAFAREVDRDPTRALRPVGARRRPAGRPATLPELLEALRGALAWADVELAAQAEKETMREANRARIAAARRGAAVHAEEPEREREQLAAALPPAWTPLREVARASGIDRIGALQATLALAHYRDGRAELRQADFPAGPVRVRRNPT